MKLQKIPDTSPETPSCYRAGRLSDNWLIRDAVGGINPPLLRGEVYLEVGEGLSGDPWWRTPPKGAAAREEVISDIRQSI